MISSAKTHLNRFDPFLWGPTGYGSAIVAVAPVSNDPTLQIWYDGQDSTVYNPAGTVGTDITQWTDKSATAHKAAPLTNATKPTVTSSLATNNKLCLYFDGGDALSANMATSLQSKSGASIIVVAKSNSSTANTQFIEGAVASGVNFTDANGFNIFQSGSYGHKIKMAGGTATTTTSLPNAGWHIYTLVFDGAGATNSDKVKFYIDGVQQTLTFTVNVNATTSATIDALIFGVDDTKSANWLTGFMGEVLVYNTTLTTTQQAATELYLKNKWGL